MEKPKRKNDEPDFYDKVFDFLLLAKSFEFEVDWTPEETSERLRMLAKSKTGFLLPIDRETKILKAVDDTYDFEIRVNRYGRGVIYNTAKAAGKVLLDNGIEKTVVRGKIELGITVPFDFLGVIFSIILILHQLISAIRDVGFAFVFLAIWLFYSLLFKRDYRRLHELLHNTFSAENEPKKKKNDE
jgi:hypothetical protein